MDENIVSQEEWRIARLELLAREKAVTLALDKVSRQRRELPWVRIEKEYCFESTKGSVSLSDLFGDNSQLIVYHFMLGPEWEVGCKSCSFVSDHFDGANLHLVNHDVSLIVVARASLTKIIEFKNRMGWEFPWVSSYDSKFNYDFGVSFTDEQLASGAIPYNYSERNNAADEMPGVSVFSKNTDGDVFHTYSAYSRGLDLLIGTHNLLDLTPKGRNENGAMDWVRHHDSYDKMQVSQ